MNDRQKTDYLPLILLLLVQVALIAFALFQCWCILNLPRAGRLL